MLSYILTNFFFLIKLWKKHSIRIHSMLEKNEIPIFRFSIKTSLRTRNSWHRFSSFLGCEKICSKCNMHKIHTLQYICTPELTSGMSRQKKNIFGKSTFLAQKIERGKILSMYLV